MGRLVTDLCQGGLIPYVCTAQGAEYAEDRRGFTSTLTNKKLCATLRVLRGSIALVAVLACGAPKTAPTPAPMMMARFSALSPNHGQTPPRNRCWMDGRFDGVAIVRDDGLELAIPNAWIAVTRDNDKQWDDLHVVVEVSRHPLGPATYAPASVSLPFVLQPTVDSAGPQLTTWQSSDTLRLLIPWKRELGPRWLIFRIAYGTLSHSSVRAGCSGQMATDTLRFNT